MSIGLDLPRQFFDGLTTAPVSTLRLLHYWPLMDFKREIGCGAHTDYGLVTLLLQDDVGGLQVLNKLSGEWIHVPPIEGALVVNLGDMMQRWTSNVFKSTIHRVVNVANVDRFSCPFFFNVSNRPIPRFSIFVM
jgi:isopenicillin N synthase-like dioxygenase